MASIPTAHQHLDCLDLPFDIARDVRYDRFQCGLIRSHTAFHKNIVGLSDVRRKNLVEPRRFLLRDMFRFVLLPVSLLARSTCDPESAFAASCALRCSIMFRMNPRSPGLLLGMCMLSVTDAFDCFAVIRLFRCNNLYGINKGTRLFS